MKNDEVTLQLVTHAVNRRKRQFGSAKGIVSMFSDFDKPSEDFREYVNEIPASMLIA